MANVSLNLSNSLRTTKKPAQAGFFLPARKVSCPITKVTKPPVGLDQSHQSQHHRLDE